MSKSSFIKGLTINEIYNHCTVNEKGCWIWNHPTDNLGYGRFQFKHKRKRVHEWIWFILKRDPLKFNEEIHHDCEDKRCGNPEHLVKLTKSQHNLVHRTKIQCPQGHPYTEDNTLIIQGKIRCKKCAYSRTIKNKKMNNLIGLLKCSTK